MSKYFSALHHVTLLISDLEQSINFYCTILELVVDKNRPNMSGEGLWLNVNDQQQIHLVLSDYASFNLEKSPKHAGLNRHFALKATDISKIIERLGKHKIPYSISKSGRKALFCRDPDNNVVEILE